MSQIALCLVDAETEWWGEPHASEVDVVIGALAAEPETLGELEAALQRFARPGETIRLAHWRGKQRNLENGYDAGLCVVHLPGRLIACESTYSYPCREGGIICGEREDGREVVVGYHLPDDWTISSDTLNWRGLASALSEKRLAVPMLDARPVLYEAVCEFIVDECLAARNDTSGKWTPPEGWELRELAHRCTSGWHKIDREPKPQDAVAEIHARWLMTPRDDLRGQTPREVLQSKRRFISADLEHRAAQWSVQGTCPPPLHPETIAYRYAGFGTHEFLVYYDLLRELIWECWERVVARWETGLDETDPEAGRWLTVPPQSQTFSRGGKPSFDREQEISHLLEHRDEWMRTPNFEDLSGEVPQDVIDMERRRIPATGDPHEHVIDDDCPLCQMMAELPGPMFWHLDGCNNDDDFPFSWHLETFEEWQQDQREFEEFSRRCKEKEELREAGLLSVEDDPFSAEGVWQQSYAAPPTEQTPVSIQLLGLGSHLAELVNGLKTDPQSASLIESLNRGFVNLGEVIEEGSLSLVGPVISRLCDELGTAADDCPDLSPQCADLARQFRMFERLNGEDDAPPF